ncbi:hypothetical protein FRX31_019145 [Thalictrum thalictroides]|uniref:Uncharacterized protein n=1 Tax=Thalictrum thalictroides TaxID=46969 RepID=A0A7J6W399_THATH|nr:hypothetical protein FRX31_019145 [Thalictrum thalictroides]
MVSLQNTPVNKGTKEIPTEVQLKNPAKWAEALPITISKGIHLNPNLVITVVRGKWIFEFKETEFDMVRVSQKKFVCKFVKENVQYAI